MSVREEFEKAFLIAWEKQEFSLGAKESALWAAKWMAERCGRIANHRMAYFGANENPAYSLACSDLKIMFRQLAKDLGE